MRQRIAQWRSNIAGMLTIILREALMLISVAMPFIAFAEPVTHFGFDGSVSVKVNAKFTLIVHHARHPRRAPSGRRPRPGRPLGVVVRAEAPARRAIAW